MRTWLLALSLCCTAAVAQPSSIRALDSAALAARQSADLQAIQIYRAGLARTLDFARTETALFPAKRVDKRLLIEADKAQARGVWKAMLDYQMALETLERFHSDFFVLKNKAARSQSLAATFAAHTARYRFALDFIDRVENDPELTKVLNEAVPELGLQAGAYDRLKLSFLNLAEGGQFAALSTLYKASSHQPSAQVAAALKADSERLWQMGRGKGATLTLANALGIARQLGQRAAFPVQAGVSEWMGDTKVRRQHQALISPAQRKCSRAT